MFAALAWGCFSFRILRIVFPSITSFRGSTPFVFLFERIVFPSITSFRGSTPFVFLSERQPMAADILPVLIKVPNCLTSSFTSHFFCFGCLIWRAFASVKSSSSRPCFHKIMRRLRVFEFDPFVSDLLLGSSRCGRIIATFIAVLEQKKE